SFREFTGCPHIHRRLLSVVVFIWNTELKPVGAVVQAGCTGAERPYRVCPVGNMWRTTTRRVVVERRQRLRAGLGEPACRQSAREALRASGGRSGDPRPPPACWSAWRSTGARCAAVPSAGAP